MGRKSSLSLSFFLIVGVSGVAHAAPQMSYEQCKQARHCFVEGMVSVQFAEPTLMGKLALPDGQCVSVSLPANTIKSLRKHPRRMAIRGDVLPDGYRDPSQEQVKINGRLVGSSTCGNFFVFVKS